MNLSIFVIVPLLMLLGLWLARNDKQVRGVMVAGASVLLGLSIYLVFAFLEARETMPADQAPMLFTYCVPWFEPLHINYSLGVDGISVVMILLTSIIVFTGTFASWQMEPMKKEYFLWFTLLSIGVYGFFISIDMFTMFMFYEVALIPMYLLIGVWGSGAKEYSAMKLTLMLMGGSALLVIGILGIYFYSGAQTFEILDIAHHTNGAHAIPESVQNVFFPLLFIGFGILGALFPFHTWSPDGHASAPTAVSMLHAGVLMKLGGYGCFRIAMFLLPAATHGFWIKVFLVLTTISIVYGALSACVQTDLKYINAYSSVSHCGMVLFALCMMTETAATGAILQMLSHGLMTALFFAVIGMIYHQAGTRDVRYLGGLMKIIPFLSVGYAVAGLANLGLPGFSGFVAEMTIFVGSFQNADTFHRVCTIIACTSIVVTAVYILRCVGKILYQKVPNPKLEKLHDATWDERIAVAGLIACVAGLGMFPLWAEEIIMDAVGPIFGILFYLLVVFAAVSSSISLLEVIVAHFVDKARDAGKGDKRKTYTLIAAACVGLGCILVCADALGSTGFAPGNLLGMTGELPTWAADWLDFWDMLSEGIMMPLGALLMSLMIGWEIGPEVVKDECEQSGHAMSGYGFFKVCVKFITPLCMILILYGQIKEFFF